MRGLVEVTRPHRRLSAQSERPAPIPPQRSDRDCPDIHHVVGTAVDQQQAGVYAGAVPGSSSPLSEKFGPVRVPIPRGDSPRCCCLSATSWCTSNMLSALGVRVAADHCVIVDDAGRNPGAAASSLNPGGTAFQAAGDTSRGAGLGLHQVSTSRIASAADDIATPSLGLIGSPPASSRNFLSRGCRNLTAPLHKRG